MDGCFRVPGGHDTVSWHGERAAEPRAEPGITGCRVARISNWGDNAIKSRHLEAPHILGSLFCEPLQEVQPWAKACMEGKDGAT